MACQDDQICAGLKAGFDGAIQGVQDLWDENSFTEEWVFLLVDANNAFSEINLSQNAVDGETFMATRSSFCLQLLSSLVINCFAER